MTMKKYKTIVTMLTMIIAALNLISCNSDENQIDSDDNNNEVKVCFIYTLDTSNGISMTRATSTNEDAFTEFYDKIINGDFVAPSFELTLKDVSNGAVYSFKGKWNSHDLISLRTGTYHVVGKSIAEGNNIQDKCSFTFDEYIEIRITSNIITLHANYDSSLLIFNNADIATLQNFNGTNIISFFTYNNYWFAFVNDSLFEGEKKDESYILGTYKDDAEFKIYTGNLTFEKGKYYVYNSVSNGFDVPRMDDGCKIALPEGYVRLNYVQSTAQQYVDTKYYPNQNTNIETKVCVDEIYNWGGFVAAEDKLHNTGIAEDQNDFYFQRCYSSDEEVLRCPFEIGIDYVLKLKDNSCYVNGLLVGKIEGTYAPYQCSSSLYLCRNNSSLVTGYSYIKMYYAKIYDGDVLVRYYIPCKSKSGEIGFYEIINEVFNPSETSVSFIAGPDY